MTQEEQKRLQDIEARLHYIPSIINDLELHRTMWFIAGGRGCAMASQADQEIYDLRREMDDLELEKEDIINGTNNLKIKKINERLETLKKLREQAIFIKKIYYKHKINNANKELQELESKPIKK